VIADHTGPYVAANSQIEGAGFVMNIGMQRFLKEIIPAYDCLRNIDKQQNTPCISEMHSLHARKIGLWITHPATTNRAYKDSRHWYQITGYEDKSRKE
jgi:hypothetical protein